MQIGQVPGFVMMLVMIGLFLGAGLIALAAFQGSMTPLSAEANATGSVIEGMGNLSAQLPTIGTIAGVAILITVVIGAFYVFGKRGQ